MTYQTGFSIAAYLRFLNRDGQAVGNAAYQNFFIAETRPWQDVDYAFAPFAIDGDQVSNATAGSRGTLVAPSNMLTQAIVAQAALERWLAEVKFVAVIPTEAEGTPVFQEVSTIAADLWVCAGYRLSRSDGSVQMELASPLDAVEARTPVCILQDYQVGSLPVTGSLLLS